MTAAARRSKLVEPRFSRLDRASNPPSRVNETHLREDLCQSTADIKISCVLMTFCVLFRDSIARRQISGTTLRSPGESLASNGYNPRPRSEPSGRGGLAESPGTSGDAAVRRGKSGLQRTGWWVTPTGREIRDSATENKPPRGSLRAVRVKRCGKSAPAGRVTGLARQTPPEARPSREQVESRGLRFATLDAARFVPDDSRVGCLRRRAIAVPEE